VRAYIQTVPSDPCDGGPLAYEVSDDLVRIHSPGQKESEGRLKYGRTDFRLRPPRE